MVSENTNLKTSFLIDVIFSLALGVHSKSSANFKFTLPAGGATRKIAAKKLKYTLFQSTLPAGGSDAVYRYLLNNANFISIHAPRGGSDINTEFR